MSTPAPQVLSRKANGASNGTPGHGSDQGSVRQRSKGAEDRSNAARFRRGKGAVDKPGSSKNANEGPAPPARPSRSKAQNEGEKLVIRRLPPAMTQEECASILGPDWEVLKGKVDWFSYVPGKVSTEYATPEEYIPSLLHWLTALHLSPSKPSRPSRAYLHLVRKDDIMPLSEIVRSSTWEDAKATFTNPVLIGPPVLEFSVYKKVAGTKRRTDARQGTIDQDPEFMSFLEALANPTPMRESIDVEDLDDAAKVETKVTSTPLVEYLKEKKASKGKDGGSGKNSKSGGKGKGGSKDEETSHKKKGKELKGEKAEKAPKEAVKILTKKAATEQAAEVAKKAASHIATANAPATATTTATTNIDAPKSRRAGIAAAARILQRDLGLSPGSAHRRARHDAAKADSDSNAMPTSKKDDDTANPDIPTSAAASAEAPPPAQSSKSRPDSPVAAKSQSGRRHRGGRNADKSKTAAAANETAADTTQPTATNPPVILKKKNAPEANKKSTESQPTPEASNSSPANSNSKQGAKEKGNNKQTSQKGSPTVTANATRAFVKHVSASQGVNDAALRDALGAFGTVTLVEIDKRKNFAYVDFSEHEALVKAVTASPLKVAQGSVHVLERKDKKAATATPAKASTAAPNGEKEKLSGGRGRRGRGGGQKTGGGQTNGQTASSPAATAKEAPASTGG
ncbi:hypothetical protein QQS21_005844 [Conoideocrella luteorostrata]|uniref:RRM domain-containing protein n=1 Tax=Conoideocrella luteorostrata TaxID=1105319 RepID=A0AAJ0CNM9_9HYPO|nr:hypothetical protein QQS21_005844 [Conoideocrella luteorostrata]